MSTKLNLLTQVLDAAGAAGLDQVTLAHAAGVAPEAISLAKKRGTIDLRTLQLLARVVGLAPTLSGRPAPISSPTAVIARRSSLADPSRGLAWSNTAMSHESLVRNALLKGSYHLVLEAVLEHGLPFVLQQWALMMADADLGMSASARADVSRKLLNIERGLSLAAS